MAAVALPVLIVVDGQHQPAGAVQAQPVELRSARIVGGDQTTTDEHPWAVYLIGRAGGQYCGGTLVAPTKVVTAAHCVVKQAPRDIRVVAGRTDTQSAAGTVVAVSSIWSHPAYQSVFSGDDVGVLTLSRPLLQQTLPLASREDERYVPNTTAKVLGWGATTESGPTSRYLRVATVPLLSDTGCAQSYQRFQSPKMVCAGYPDGRVDACQGDSGGPLVARGRLIGITSWGEGCALAGKPGVYTRVAQYTDQLRTQLLL